VRGGESRGLTRAHGPQTLLQRSAGGKQIVIGIERRGTRVGPARELAHVLRIEELDDARRAYRPVHRPPQPKAVDRRVLNLELPRVRSAARRVIRRAVPGVDAQILRALLAFDDRNAHFGEVLFDVDGFVDGHRGTTEPGQETALLGLVRLEALLLVPAFVTDVDR